MTMTDDRAWVDQAACRDALPVAHIFDDTDAPDEALAYCKRCPVVAECLAWVTGFNAAAPASGGFTGIAGGAVITQPKRHLHTEADARDWSDERVRELYREYGRGRRSPVVVAGRREYERRASARQRQRARGGRPARAQVGRDVLLTRYAELRGTEPGISRANAAARLGVSKAALHKALSRAAADGDPRSDACDRSGGLPPELTAAARSWSDERVRGLRSAYRRGRRTDAAVAGQREYERRTSARRRARERAA